MSAHVALVTTTRLSDEGRRILCDGAVEAVYMPAPITETELIAYLAQSKATAVLMSGNPPFTRRVMESAPQLKIIAKHGSGVDSVDLAAASERGIAVMIAAAANADAVAELTLAMMLSLARQLPRLDRSMRNGAWERPRFEGRGFGERTVGIVGYGEIGRRVARLATAFSAKVLIHSRSAIAAAEEAQVEPDFEALLARVDILSLHCPLTERTRGMLGAAQLRLMKPGALLVNTARGALVDEVALAEALKSGHLAGAGLDTFACEPPDPSNPLFALDNVILTPHIGGATHSSARRRGVIAASNIVRYLRGEAPDRANLVNPDVLGRTKSSCEGGRHTLTG